LVTLSEKVVTSSACLRSVCDLFVELTYQNTNRPLLLEGLAIRL
jgi:hypothetical protein